MPAKRVSVKGQGADLFFGGTQPSSTDEQVPDEARIATAAVEPDVPADAVEVPPFPSPVARPNLAHPVNDLTSLPGAEAPPGSRNGGTFDSEQNSYRASELVSASGHGIEAIRRVVKQTGREVSFVRLSAEEKGRLADIVYTYRRQGRKTTENELNRIAINALLDDYDANGAQSVLARVLDALHA